MRVHYLQHVPFEDSANIGKWVEDNGGSLTKTEIYEGEPFPELADIDMLAIMGGPMNIYQYRDYPWLKEEKKFIEEAITKKVKVIGVCLGAQLIADVLGAKITQNPFIEIGWHEVTLNNEGINSLFFKGFPEKFTALHWHGDTFAIPGNALHLASSQACANQVLSYENHVIGLQFHLEYSQESIEKMLKYCAEELVDAPYIQSAEVIRDGYIQIKETYSFLGKLLDNLYEAE